MKGLSALLTILIILAADIWPSTAFLATPSWPSSAVSRSLPHFAISDNQDALTEENPSEEVGTIAKIPSEASPLVVYTLPVVCFVASFNMYGGISRGFHSLVEAASGNNWVPVDGGELIGSIILPAINGPVLGTISLLFATLVSTTIGNLYERQMSITACIVREVDDLRRLGYLLQSLPEPYRSTAQTELRFFVNSIFEAAMQRSVRQGDTYRYVTLAPLFQLLNQISDDVERKETVLVSGNILAEGYELLRRINDQRAQINALLRPAFPALHYANLVVLASTICLVFLMETDRNVIFFLASFQLKLLWAILIGIFAMMATVIYDLETPFGGSFNVIASSNEELDRLRAYVTLSWKD